MNEYKKLDLKQNALKILINSIYGAFANKYFYFHNVDIAQSITLQGQDLIKFSIRAINHYFNNLWHKDTELHQKLGIDGFKINKINEPASVYTDTDSVYMQFGSALRSIEGLPELTEEEKLRFCIDVNKYRLDGYLKQCFESYGKAYNTKNQQNFELENLSTYGIWVKKKNYAINVAYEPNKNEMLLRDIDGKSDYLIVKGLEIVKSSYPAWARDNLTKITKLFLKKGYDISIDDDIILLLKQLKEEFKLKNIDDISFNFRMGVYDKYVKSENPIVIEKGIPIYARAGVIYNNRLIVNGIEGKYEKLMEGDKIKFYYCNEEQTGVDVFAYSPGSYPIEIFP
jgi:DNA polymerase elongation subunit (family B)